MDLLPKVTESDLSGLAAVYMGNAFQCVIGDYLTLSSRQIRRAQGVCRLPRRLPDSDSAAASRHHFAHAANRNSAFFWLWVSLYELVSKHIIIVKFDISSVTLLLPYNFQNCV